MEIKLVKKLYLEKEMLERLFIYRWHSFLNGDKNSDLEPLFKRVKSILDNNDYLWLDDKFIYYSSVKACWYGVDSEGFNSNSYLSYWSNGSTTSVVKKLNETFETPYKLDLPTKNELIKSVRNFDADIRYCLYKIDGGTFKGYDKRYKEYHESGRAVPILRLAGENSFNLSNREIFFRFIVLGLTPTKLKNDEEYKRVIEEFKNTEVEMDGFFKIKSVNLKDNFSDSYLRDFYHFILNEDKIRANIESYPYNILCDSEQGHWSLWDIDKNKTEKDLDFMLDDSVVSRNPKLDIIDGVLAIEFGSKTTKVSYQIDREIIYKMRVDNIDEYMTVLEFNDFNSFIDSYNSRDGKPYTTWESLKSFEVAYKNFLNITPDDYYYSFVVNLKEWVNSKNKVLRFIDKNGYSIDIKPFLSLENGDINLLEIYAYYLGLYINNQRNGIFMNYLISFPINFSGEVKNKILESFNSGIKKSLPQELHNQDNEISKLLVIEGVNELSAYAVSSLNNYLIEPEYNQKIFYSVFDFGSDSIRYNFGIFRESDETKIEEINYSYVLEELGADIYYDLGADKLLELLSCEVLRDNQNIFLENFIEFSLSKELERLFEFDFVISNSIEAKINILRVIEILRQFLESSNNNLEFKDNVVLELFDKNSKLIELNILINSKNLENIMLDRIEKIIVRYFSSLQLDFDNRGYSFKNIAINIFLAGGMSKLNIVSELFTKKLEEFYQNFNLYNPIVNGISSGLIQARKGGIILVVNKDNSDISFKYCLGINKKKKFKTIIDKNSKMNEWIKFRYPLEDVFDIYYIRKYNMIDDISISDSGIKKISLIINVVDKDAVLYLRLISDNSFEYVVSNEIDIEKEEYLNKPVLLELED